MPKILITNSHSTKFAESQEYGDDDFFSNFKFWDSLSIIAKREPNEELCHY